MIPEIQMKKMEVQRMINEVEADKKKKVRGGRKNKLSLRGRTVSAYPQKCRELMLSLIRIFA